MSPPGTVAGTTATGTTEYELRDPGEDARAFVGSVKLAAGV